MNDNELSTMVRESVAHIHSDTTVAQVIRRGRAVRARSRISAAAGGLAVITAAAVVLGLSGAFGSAQDRGTGTIRTTAFTLVKHTNGTATLTIHPNELLDAAALQHDLHQDGIPALVTTGRFCFSNPKPAGFAQAVSFYPMPAPGLRNVPPGQATITFNPAAMPAGTELSFGDFRLSSGGQQADFALINSNSYTCTSIPPPFSSREGTELLTGSPAGS
jgi:hypothetical protein